MAATVLVDDDEIEAAGREVVLRRAGHDVRVLPWAAFATAGTAVVGHAEVAILVVRADPDRWDRYQALRSTGDVSAQLPSTTRVVALVDELVASDPILGLRLAAAGVGEVAAHAAFRSGAGLDGLVRGEHRGRAPAPDALDLAWCRIGVRCNPGRVIDRVLQMAEDDPSLLRAFQPGVQQNESGLSRRRAHTLRVKVAELGDLRPGLGRSMGGPVRDQSLPRWSEVVEFVNRCRGLAPDYTASLPLLDRSGSLGVGAGR